MIAATATPAPLPAPLPSSAAVWRRHLIALAALTGVILTLFRADVAAMAMIWWDSSTFNHCLLMLPMIGWLVMQRWPAVRTLTPVAWWPALLWIGGAALSWLIGEAAGVALFRQAAVILSLQGAVALVLGPQVTRAIMFPMGYALLLIPFGEELVPLLQTVTAHLSVALLGFTGIPAHMEGVFITTPDGFFEVAEACSGINFLIAMLAYAVFAAHLCFRGTGRRLVFVACALIVTIFANAIRAFATMAAAGIWGIEVAAGFDHIFYGWIFFGLVLLAVMLVARRWFDRPADDAAVDVSRIAAPARGRGPLWPLAAAGAALIVLAPVWAASGASRSGTLPQMLAVTAPAGWAEVAAPATPWAARFDGADRRVVRHFRRGTQQVAVVLAGFARQGEGRELVGYGQGAIDPDGGWAWSAALDPVDGGRAERLLHAGPVLRDAVTWFLVDGQLTGDPRRAKLLGLRARLAGGDPRGLALIVSAESSAGGRDAIAAFVAASGGAKALADRAIKLR